MCGSGGLGWQKHPNTTYKGNEEVKKNGREAEGGLCGDKERRKETNVGQMEKSDECREGNRMYVRDSVRDENVCNTRQVMAYDLYKVWE